MPGGLDFFKKRGTSTPIVAGAKAPSEDAADDLSDSSPMETFGGFDFFNDDESTCLDTMEAESTVRIACSYRHFSIGTPGLDLILFFHRKFQFSTKT